MRLADQRLELARQRRAVDARPRRFLDPLDGAALHEQALDRIERRQRVMPRLQRPHLGRDAEQLAEKILEMRRQIDQQIEFVEPLDARRDRAVPSSACCAGSASVLAR